MSSRHMTLIICMLLVICVSLLGSMKKREAFNNSSYKWNYDAASNIVLQSKNQKRLENTESTMSCQKSCTLDKSCIAVTYDGVTKDCYLLPSIDEVNANTSGGMTVRSSYKARPVLEDNKQKAFVDRKLPNSRDGTISVHNNVRSLNDCNLLCVAAGKSVSDANKSACIAFEYDYDNETCKINSSIKGALEKDEGKITYVNS